MSLIEFVAAYGYAAVLLGTLFEGETILLLAGFAAHQGYLALHWVLLIAFIGGTAGDQAFFWVGRTWGGPLLHRFPAVRERTLRVGALLRRWDAVLVFGIRFMYGLRISGPIAMGALGFAAGRFAVFNALGAAVWSLAIGGAGYLLGHSVEKLLGDLEGYEGALLWSALGVVVVGVALQHAARAVRSRLARGRKPQPLE